MANETAIEERETQITRPEPMRGGVTYLPTVDIVERPNELLLIADLPGVVEKGLTINLDHDQLFIDARCDEEDFGTPLARELRLVDYRRSFVVPQGIDRNRISAELTNGVLHLHLPKADSIKPRRIEVKAG